MYQILIVSKAYCMAVQVIKQS